MLIKFKFSVPAAKSVQGDYFLNGDFMIDLGQVKTMSGSAFEYRRSLAGREVLVSQGPLKEPLLVEVIHLIHGVCTDGISHWLVKNQ